MQEGKISDVAEPEGDHLQDHRREISAKDLRLGIFRPAHEVLFGIQPDGDTVAGAAAPTGPLVGAGLADRFNRQPLHLRAHAVARDARRARVNHVLDPRHGETRLGHVGGEHDATADAGGSPGLEDPVLLCRTQPAVEREHLGERQGATADRFLGIPDLVLPAEEDQHVAVRFPRQFVEGGVDALHRIEVGLGLHVLLFVLFIRDRCLGHERSIPHFHGEGAPAHLDDGSADAPGIREVSGEALGIDGRGGDDDTEIGALRHQLFEVAEQEVNGEAAFVGLIDDDRVILAQQTIPVDLIEQDAVGHQLDAGVGAHGVGETHLVSDQAAERSSEFLGDAFGDGARRDPPRLGVADARLAEFEQNLRKLRCLARPGLASDNHDLVIADGRRNILAALADRKVLRIGDPVVGGRVGHGCPILPTASPPHPPSGRGCEGLALFEASRYSKAEIPVIARPTRRVLIS